MINKYTWFFVFLLLVCGNIAAQVPYFQPYYLLKKNESVQVNTIFQDQSGFIWFGTNKGLFKFNGKNYQHFTKTDSLPDEQVTAIAQDADGKIWTGHKNGNLAYFENGKFHVFKTQEGSSTESVSDILFDKQGVMWFSTMNDGLYYYTRNRLYRLDEADGMPDLFVYDLLADTTGNIWAGTDGGVVICKLQNEKVNIRVLNLDDGLPDNIVKKLAMAGDSIIYLGTEDAGVISYDPKNGKFQFLTSEKWRYGAITDIVLRSQQLWISTSNPGLVVFDANTRIFKEYNHKTSLTLAPVSCMMKDREGNIWAATKSGIVRTPGDNLEFIYEPVAGGDANIMALATDRDGNLWFSTKEGLFKRHRTDAGDIVTEKQLKDPSLRNYRIISLYVDSDNYVWAGLYGEGAMRINQRTGKVKRLTRELRNGNVLHISGKSNVVWLATLGGAEKITFEGEHLTILNYNRQNGLSSDFIYQVFTDSQDNVWFATDGKGVDMLDKSGFHHYENGLSSKVVYGFAEQGQIENDAPVIWLNTQSDGLYYRSGDKFSRLRFQDTLSQVSNFHALSSDNSKNLITIHDLGIDVYNLQTRHIRHLSEEVGIQGQQANLNAVTKDRYGNILFGTDHGIIQYNNAGKHTDLQSGPKVIIDAVKAAGKALPVDKEILLRYNENDITINFIGFWYESPESVVFQYKMDNYDNNWIATGDNNVTYSQLPPGNYTFRLRGTALSSSSPAEEAVLTFIIRPPFWRTPVFYVASFIAVIIASYSILKYRERKLKEDKLILEAKVEQRTREIQLKTEEIQAQNEEIMAQAEEINGINENLEMLVKQRTEELEKKNKALEEYAFINAHKLRSPLASILGCIHLISKTKLDEEAKEINRHLRQRADELDDVVREITKAIERGEQ